MFCINFQNLINSRLVHTDNQPILQILQKQTHGFFMLPC